MVDVTIDNYIKTRDLPGHICQDLASRLTFPNPEFVNAARFAGDNPRVSFIPRVLFSYIYNEATHEFGIPRGYYFDFLALLYDHKIPYQIVSTPQYEQVNVPKLNITPRYSQIKAIKEAKLYPGPSLLLKAPPGAGKTFAGLIYAQQMHRKVLWICHKEILMRQAIESAQEVLNLDEDEIGIIGRGKFKIGEFLTVALVQTLYRKRFELEKYRYLFGTIIIDEVHHGVAMSWNTSNHIFAPQNTLGLTATDYRDDGLTSMMHSCVGPTVAQMDKQLLLEENVLVVPSYHPFATGISIGSSSYAALLTELGKIEKRNNLLLDITERAVNYKDNHVILLLSHRTEHVDLLTRMAAHRQLPIVKLHGQMKKTDKTLSYTKLNANKVRVIATTFQLLGEGFDYPSINITIPTTPFKGSVSFEQILGRAQRAYNDKNYSWILDPVDNNRICKNQAEERTYNALGLSLDIQWVNPFTIFT